MTVSPHIKKFLQKAWSPPVPGWYLSPREILLYLPTGIIPWRISSQGCQELHILESRRPGISGDNSDQMSNFLAAASKHFLEVGDIPSINLTPERDKVSSQHIVQQVGEGVPGHLPDQLDARVPTL